ncbi:glycosyl hydrolase family 18 protein [uncultured Vibrio sp.]|uniref:glycosyl hydrolase family 18 protein n=1 Tax=uncultured Vibrio sp. TaxID=114054 RepID=UPI0026227116|nr:glycosyl hydrolase family 18 protein [uncultured Vibrio sp.]
MKPSILASVITLTLSSSYALANNCTDIPQWQDYYPVAEEGDNVQHLGHLYECKPFPASGWCRDINYEPGTVWGEDAWTHLGECDVAEQPIISIDAPTVVPHDQSFEVSVTITDPNEVGIDYADFFIVTEGEETFIERITEAPYNSIYPELSPGIHYIIVRSSDRDGNYADDAQSTLLSIDMEEPATLLITPRNGERILENTPITFEAIADTLNPEDNITKVEFLIDDDVVGESSESPFRFTLESGLPEGQYNFSSRVHTELDKVKDSNIATVIIYIPGQWEEEFNPYWTSWGTDSAQMEELSDQITTIHLAFVGMNEDFELIGTNSLLQYRGDDSPEFVDNVDPTYMNWTTKKYLNPETKISLAMGGAHETQTWQLLKNTENVPAYVNSLNDIVNDVFPVYEQIESNRYQKVGYVQIDGLDLDIEALDIEKDPIWSENIVTMIDSFTENNPNKVMYLTGMHTAGDAPSCQQGGSFEEGCSYPAGSAYAGSLTLVLEGIKDNDVALAKYQVMAYDAGRQGIEYDWEVALENIAKYIPREDIILGVSIGSQWSPGGVFVEPMDEIKTKALRQKELGYGGVMSWAVGAGGAEVPTTQVQQMNEIAESFKD